MKLFVLLLSLSLAVVAVAAVRFGGPRVEPTYVPNPEADWRSADYAIVTVLETPKDAFRAMVQCHSIQRFGGWSVDLDVVVLLPFEGGIPEDVLMQCFDRAIRVQDAVAVWGLTDYRRLLFLRVDTLLRANQGPALYDLVRTSMNFGGVAPLWDPRVFVLEPSLEDEKHFRFQERMADGEVDFKTLMARGFSPTTPRVQVLPPALFQKTLISFPPGCEGEYWWENAREVSALFDEMPLPKRAWSFVFMC